MTIKLGWFPVIAILACQPFLASAADEDFGQLGVDRRHAAWPSPPSVVRDLLSSDSETRSRALLLVGVPAAVIGSDVVKPDQVELRYAVLGSDETRQAIVVAQVRGDTVVAAVATPKASAWERIAVLSCWCKYDWREPLDTFVSLSFAPGQGTSGKIPRYELVLRASGGGTGLYDQNEVHFRFYKGEMKAVMSFMSSYQRAEQGIPPPQHFIIERRWFSLQPDQTAVLVEGRGQTAIPIGIPFTTREQGDRYLKTFTCRVFQWNEKLFRYEPDLDPADPNPCRPTQK